MLEVKNLSFQYPNGEVIFDDFSQSFPANGIVHLKGPNGSGKTTLLKTIATLISPQSGSISLDGNSIDEADVNYLTSAETSFFNQVTGQEGLDLFLRLNKTSVEKSKAKFFLEDPLFPKVLTTQFYQMSTGMKRLLLMMVCFTKDAKIFLLDEPFLGVDKNRKEQLTKILEEVSKDTLILITTHESENHFKHSCDFSLREED